MRLKKLEELVTEINRSYFLTRDTESPNLVKFLTFINYRINDLEEYKKLYITNLFSHKAPICNANKCYFDSSEDCIEFTKIIPFCVSDDSNKITIYKSITAKLSLILISKVRICSIWNN